MRVASKRVGRELLLAWPLVVFAGAAPAGAEIYRWTDSDGRLHFTESLEQVPPDQRDAAQRRLGRPTEREVQTYSAPSRPAARAPSGASGDSLRVPFVRMGTLMRVDVVLNDRVTAPFLIDTGASGVSIPRAVADRLGIRIGPNTPHVRVETANGITAQPVVTLASVRLGGARVENLPATVNPSMEIGLLGGAFFNHFVYQVDAAAGVISLAPNDKLKGGFGEEEWRAHFRKLRDPLERLEAYLRDHPDLSQGEREQLEQRREALQTNLAELEREANRLDVPYPWRK